MSQSLVSLESVDGVATITLNDPDKLNALSIELMAELKQHLDRCDQDEAVRVVVITGAGKGFCAGADLSGNPAGDQGSSSGNVIAEQFNPVIEKLVNLSKPTIAAVNGVAAGGGYGVAMACDLVIASERAKFILVFTPKLALIPDMGSTWYAPQTMGRAKAMASAFLVSP